MESTLARGRRGGRDARRQRFTLIKCLALLSSPSVVWRDVSAPRGTISFSFSRQWRRWARRFFSSSLCVDLKKGKASYGEAERRVKNAPIPLRFPAALFAQSFFVGVDGTRGQPEQLGHGRPRKGVSLLSE